MSIKKLIVIIGLCVLSAACSTGGYYNTSYGNENNTQLGARYLLGRGVRQNDAQAFYYFHQAALQGDPFAQNELAYLYASGKGTARNPAKAFKWYEKAAEHGLASAQFNLGLLYLYGVGTAPNKALAKKWIEKSAAHGFEPAVKMLAQL